MFDTTNYLLNVAQGAWLTVSISLLSLLISLAIGLPVACARLAHNRLINIPATLYTTFFRGVPDLVLMFFLFYGGQMLANSITDYFNTDIVEINPFAAGCVTIGLIFGAYMAETFRGAILAVPHGQLDAARAFGMNRRQIFYRIIFPQMLRNALPGVGNNWLVLLKTTALVSLIGLSDMVHRADLAGKKTQQPLLYYSAVALIFLLFTSLSIWVLKILKKRYNQGFAARKQL